MAGNTTQTHSYLWWSPDGATMVPVSASNPLPVTTSGGGGGAVTIADGANVVEGSTTDTAITTDANGTLSGKLRGLVKIFGSVWDSINSRLNVYIQNTSLPVTQSTAANLNATVVGTGTFATQTTLQAGSAVVGKVSIDQTTPGTTNAVSTTNFPATVSTGTGAQGASSPRVTVATDTATVAGSAPGTAGSASSNVLTVQGIASMTKLLVTPDSVALPANQSVNVAQVNGVTTLTGTGATNTGSQRVTVAVDSATVAGSATLPAGTNLVGKVGIDQTTVGTTNAISLAQIGATTVATSNGTASAGCPRVAVVSNNSAVALWGHGATGSAVPANGVYSGLLAKTALPAAGSDGNLIGGMADKFGRMIVRGAPRELLVTTATSTTGTSGTLLASQGAGVFADLYRCTISNSSATTVAVTLSDATNSYTFVIPSGSTVPVISGTPDGATPAASAATAWSYAVSSGVSSIFFAAQFILNK